MQQGKRPMQSKDLQQNKQSSLDKRKRILSDLNSTLTQSGPDKEITRGGIQQSPQKNGKAIASCPHTKRFDTWISRT